MARNTDEQGPEGIGKYRQPFSGDEDVEGHLFRQPQSDEGGPEGIGKYRQPLTDDGAGPEGLGGKYRQPLTDDQDVEGHLYTGGPSTQGEFVRRAPETPHGD